MIYIQTDIEHCIKSDGKIGAVFPRVNMGIDVGDNFDMEKLTDLKNRLQRFLYAELNKCIVEQHPDTRNEQ